AGVIGAGIEADLARPASRIIGLNGKERAFRRSAETDALLRRPATPAGAIDQAPDFLAAHNADCGILGDRAGDGIGRAWAIARAQRLERPAMRTGFRSSKGGRYESSQKRQGDSKALEQFHGSVRLQIWPDSNA